MTGSSPFHVIADDLADQVRRFAVEHQGRARFGTEWESAVMSEAIGPGVFCFYDVAKLAVALDCRVTVTLRPTARKKRIRR